MIPWGGDLAQILQLHGVVVEAIRVKKNDTFAPCYNYVRRLTGDWVFPPHVERILRCFPRRRALGRATARRAQEGRLRELEGFFGVLAVAENIS